VILLKPLPNKRKNSDADLWRLAGLGDTYFDPDSTIYGVLEEV
jgi:hypothetical protein